MPNDIAKIASPPPSSNITGRVTGPSFNLPTDDKKIKVPPYDPKEGKSLAQGFGKITSKINKAINKVRVAINNFYYGKENISTNKKLQNPLDYGLINLLNLIASVDLCNVFTYASNELPGTKPFKPTEKPTTTFGKIKYQIQNSAYEIQAVIDEYYTSNADTDSVISKTALGSLVSELKQFLSLLLSSDVDNPFKNPQIKQAFPSITVMENYLQNSLAQLNKYTDINSLKTGDIEKIIGYIDKTREVCVAVQALNKPSNLIAFADTFFGSNIGEEIKKLDKVIDPKRITPILKNIINTCGKIKNATDQILGYVNQGRTIIYLGTILIKIFKIISKFLSTLPVPSIFTTVGVNVISSRANEKMQYWSDYFLKRLSEVSSVLNNIYYVAQDVSIKIGNLIELINLIRINLENCNQNIDPTILPQLQTLTTQLQTAKDELDNFVKTYENNKKQTDSIYGSYTIQILTEALVDEGIVLKRRYGIALDSNGVVIVESTPTFASSDQIIIQEVKLLLISKKLVTPKINVLSANELSILEESLNYLQDPDINLNQLEELNFESALDEPENEDEEQDNSLNLNAFVSKLKGGRRLRRRMRKMMAKQKLQLASDLQKSDTGGKFTSGIVKKQRVAALKDAIKSEEELIRAIRDEITVLVPLSITNPSLKIVIIKKKKQIVDIKTKISGLNAQLSELK